LLLGLDRFETGDPGVDGIGPEPIGIGVRPRRGKAEAFAELGEIPGVGRARHRDGEGEVDVGQLVGRRDGGRSHRDRRRRLDFLTALD
jgi:hypothetical protein